MKVKIYNFFTYCVTPKRIYTYILRLLRVDCVYIKDALLSFSKTDVFHTKIKDKDFFVGFFLHHSC